MLAAANHPAPCKTFGARGRLARIAVRLSVASGAAVLAAFGCDPGVVTGARLANSAKGRATAARFGLAVGGNLLLVAERSGFAGAVDCAAECGEIVAFDVDSGGDFLAELLFAQAADNAEAALFAAPANTCAA